MENWIIFVLVIYVLYGRCLERKAQVPRHKQFTHFAQSRYLCVKIDLNEKTINSYPTVVNRAWRVRVDHRALTAYTSLKAIAIDDWYFDSGCYRRMNGVKSYLSNVKSCVKGHVTFGDDAKGTVVGKGQVNVTSLPALDNVLLVEGLTANLISISKLYDEGLTVNFSKDCCTMVSKDVSMMMKGTSSSDNCYLWNAPSTVPSTSCLVNKEDVTKL